MTKIFKWLASAVLVAIVASSCASSRRLDRSLSSYDRGTGLPDPDRMNYWPIASRNAGMTSVLWPLMDFDDKGFAIRPLLAKDEDDVSLLWPLSGWNTAKGDGWFLNAYFDFKPDFNYFGIFPLCHFEKDSGFFIPAYWHDSGWGVFPLMYSGDDRGYALTAYWSDEFWGAFPLVHMQKDMSGGYVFPFFWAGDTLGVFPLFYHSPKFSIYGPVWRSETNSGLFPLYYHSPELTLLGPLWRSTNAGGLFPLYTHYRDGDKSGHNVLGILAHVENSPDRHMSWVFPLYYLNSGKDDFKFVSVLGGSYEQGGYKGSFIAPLWWNHQGPDSHHTLLFPLYYSQHRGDTGFFASPVAAHGSKGDESWTWAFPTWYSKTSPTESSAYLHPFWGQRKKGDTESSWLFPVYFHRRDGENTSLFTPLAAHGSKGDESWIWAFPTWYSKTSSTESSANLYPLWGQRKKGDTESSWLLPFYYHGRDGENTSLYTPLGNRNVSTDFEMFNVYPLWWSYKDDDVSVKAFLPFYASLEFEGKKSIVTPLGGYGWGDEKDGTFVNVLGPFYHHQKSGDGTFELTAAAWPLYTRWRLNDETREYVPLIYSRHETPERTKIGFAAELGQIDTTKDGTSWMFWPLVCQSDQPKLPNAIWNTTLIKSHTTAEETDLRVTPLFWRTEQKEGLSTGLIPLYDYTRTVDEADLDILVFFGDYNRDKTGSSWRAWPLVAQSTQDRRPDPLYYVSLASFHEFEDEGSWWVTPLVGSVHEGDDRFTWALPVGWWSTDEESFDGRFLAGLVGLETEKGQFREFDVFPSIAVNADATGSSWRVWPLAAHSTQEHRPDFLHYLSLLSRHEYNDNGSWWVTPFVGSVHNGDDRFTWALPVGWWSTDEDSFDGRFLMGLAGLETEKGHFREFDLFPSIAINKDDTGNSWRVWPLAANSNQRHRPDILHYLSLSSRHEYNGEGNWWVTPFVGSAHSGSERVSWALPLGWCETDEDSFDGRFLMGLGGLETEDGKFNDFDLFPLVSVSKDRHPFWLHHLYLFNWHAIKGDGYDFGIFPILGMRSSGTPGVDLNKRFNILGPLVFDRRTQDTKSFEHTATNMLLLGYGTSQTYKNHLVPDAITRTTHRGRSTVFPFYYSSNKRERKWTTGVFTKKEMNLLGGWWRKSLNAPQGSHSDDAVIRLLKAKGVVLNGTGRESVKAALLAFVEKNSKNVEHSRHRSLLHSRTVKGDDKRWSVLLKMVSHGANPVSGTSYTHVFWGGLYSSDTNGSDVRRSFFPFFKWDSSKTWSDFSFAGNIWHRRTENGKKSGHFLFIPWGKK